MREDATCNRHGFKIPCDVCEEVFAEQKRCAIVAYFWAKRTKDTSEFKLTNLLRELQGE